MIAEVASRRSTDSTSCTSDTQLLRSAGMSGCNICTRRMSSGICSEWLPAAESAVALLQTAALPPVARLPRRQLDVYPWGISGTCST